MKAEIAKAEWKNAVEALNDAITLTIGGGYKGAESRAYFAMEHAARAALATKNQEPKTHTSVEKAVNNQLVRSGEITADSGAELGAGRQKRQNADYSSFYECLRLRGDSSIGTGMEWAPERGRSGDAEVSFSWRRVLRGVRGGCPVAHAAARAEDGVCACVGSPGARG